MSQQVFCGNNIEVLKKYPDNHFDSIVTDPPYGLSFMGKKWDYDVPSVEFWKEAFRVLKHGGHLLSFSGTRTYHRMVVNIEDAGFEIRDQIQWIYGSGFPKSHNINKAINKIDGVEFEAKPASGVGFMKADSEDWNVTKNQLTQTGESSDREKQWDGWGTALKPANEPICVARKPLEKGMSVAENVLKYGTGGINIDATRIGESGARFNGRNVDSDIYGKYGVSKDKEVYNYGRFPANVILTHHPECVCKGTKKVKPSNGSGKASEKGGGFSKGMFGDGTSDNIGGGFTDADGNETIENWECVDGCPIKLMDEQSGISKSQRSERGNIINNNVYGKYKEQEDTLRGHSDKGGASRFFYCAKASKSERNRGLQGFEEKELNMSGGRVLNTSKKENDKREILPRQNFHPTVKPVKLMEYLVRMVTPLNGIVLDPFNGSGTTGVACKISGFNYVGIDMDEDYVKISQARIDNYNGDDYDNKEDTKEETANNKTEKEQLNLF